MQYSIVNLLDFSPWSFLTCSFFISILLGTRTGAPHHWLFPRRPPLPFSSCATLEAAWRMYASSTFFVLRYVALHRFSSLVQPLKYINLIKKKKWRRPWRVRLVSSTSHAIIYISRSEFIFFTAHLLLQQFWGDCHWKHVATSPGWPIRFGVAVGRR